MRGRLVIIVLCSLTFGCPVTEDTKAPEVWGRRPLEARLTAYPLWQSAERLAAQSHEPVDCDRELKTASEVVSEKLLKTGCLDQAITALEQFAVNDNRALSDLGAAYYTRAEHGHPGDYLASLRASELALAATPNLAPARFNRALALEKLGFTHEAIVAWDEFQKSADSPAWQSEAHAHRERLVAEDVFNGSVEWQKAAEKLDGLIRAGNVKAVEDLIRAFPSLAEARLFDGLLPQWAADPSPERLAFATTLATALSNVTRDPYAREVVAACEPTASIRKGISTYVEARHSRNQWGEQKGLYANAAQLLAGHPFALMARARHAVSVSFDRDTGPTDALQLLSPLENDARRYPNLLARVYASQGYCLYVASQYAQSIAAYSRALAIYQAIPDLESVVRMQSRIGGSYKTAGRYQLAWDWAMRPLATLNHCVDSDTRTVALGEASDAAQALGYPKYALAYQNRNIAEQAGQALLIALLKRAALYLELDRPADAQADLVKAAELLPATNDDASNRRALQSRLLELQGRAEQNPRLALARFEAARQMIGADELNTFRASLLAQMADVHDRLNQHDLATQNRLAALEELRAEQKKNLATRKPGDAEDLWSAYFSRFQSMVERLVRYYAERHDAAAAFAQAEQARGSEPLNLLLQRSRVPSSFRESTRGGESLDLPAIRAALPAGTFLLEYAVFGDDTFVWIVSHDHEVVLLQLPVQRSSIERWAAAVQQTAVHHEDDRFRTIVKASYDALVREPLNAVLRMDAAPRRLVFVPDGAMHALPFSALYDTERQRFLCEVAPIESAPSATLYAHSLARDLAWRQHGEPSVLLVGDPAFDVTVAEAQQMDRLSGAREEVRQIGDLYPNVTKLEDEDATVPNFLQRTRNSTVVHFAGHAVPNRDAPQFSYLLLAPSEKDDGVLDAQELLTESNLENTRLVVLSACSSAGGAPVGPEGVSPLVRPLITAGVPAVIGSLWDVDDATAVKPLVSFHRHYEQGQDAAVAMQQMQLGMLRKDKSAFRSVLAWAPFQVIGHASSPFGAEAAAKEIHHDISRTYSVQRSDGVRSQ